MIDKKIEEYIYGKIGYLATVSKDGFPNIGPKISARFLDQNHLVWHENTQGQTLKNILDNGLLSMCFVDEEELTGYRFSGKAVILESGEQFDKLLKYAIENGLGNPTKIGVLTVEKIYLLDKGPKAGTLIKSI